MFAKDSIRNRECRSDGCGLLYEERSGLGKY